MPTRKDSTTIGQTAENGPGGQAPSLSTGEAFPGEDALASEKEAKALYENLCEVTGGIYHAVAEGVGIDISPVAPVAESLVDSIVSSDKAITDSEPLMPSLYSEVVFSPITPQDWAVHAVHVATLSVKLAVGLSYSRDDLVKLAMAGILHGAGMMRLPRPLLEKTDPLSPEERSLVETHPILGAEALSELGPELEWLRTVVLQEHERHGGQGYPNGLAGKDIHKFARIIGLMDIFISMTHFRPWRPARSPHEAAKEVVNVHKGEFDPQLIKVFLKKMTIFPTNSLVKLSNEAIGRVLVIHEDASMRPTVEMLREPSGEPPDEPTVLDLRKCPLLYVLDTVEELAITDSLTKLHDRASFNSKLEEEHARTVRYKIPLSLILLEIDRFESIDYDYGPQAGDTYLDAVAGLVARSVRQVESVARYGSGMVVILPHTGSKGAMAVAERLRAMVEAFEVPFGDGAIRRTASIGVTSYFESSVEAPDEFLKSADHALNAARKQGGENCVALYLGDTAQKT